jgi:Rha family phage regulatory protein
MSKIKSKQKKDLVEVFEKDDQLWTTSLDVAEKFGKRHDDVLKAIRNLDCSESFKLRNFAGLSQTVRGGTQKYYIISRDGFSFLAMGFRGKKAAEWKEKFIEAFNEMEKTILRLAYQARRQGQKEWLQARAEGKVIRREETDTIKEFVEYATSQGSKSARMYYVNITKMVNSHLFFLEQSIQPDNLREWLNHMQLIHLSVADNLVAKALREGMEKGMYYKAVYTMAKERIIAFSKVIGRTSLLLEDQPYESIPQIAAIG